MVTPTKLGFGDLSKMEPLSFKLRQLKIDLPTTNSPYLPQTLNNLSYVNLFYWDLSWSCDQSEQEEIWLFKIYI